MGGPLRDGGFFLACCVMGRCSPTALLGCPVPRLLGAVPAAARSTAAAMPGDASNYGLFLLGSFQGESCICWDEIRLFPGLCTRRLAKK